MNNKGDSYLTNSVASLMNHQQEMQDAQALLASEPDSYSKPRQSREAYEAKLNAGRTTSLESAKQAPVAPQVNNKGDSYLTNRVASLMNHQQEMQDAQALLASEPDSYSKPRQSREAYEAKLNAGRTTSLESAKQAPVAPQVNNKGDSYLTNRVASLMNHQQEMQD
ncbi:hypothetical protein EAH72_34665, partial [Pseudomonas caspiana]